MKDDKNSSMDALVLMLGNAKKKKKKKKGDKKTAGVFIGNPTDSDEKKA